MNRRRLLVSALAILGLVLLGATGLVRVPTGEARLRTDGARLTGVWETGLHWRLPGTGPGLAIPRTPLPWSGEIEGRTPEGAAVVARVGGGFALKPGREADWLAAAGAVPFLDGLSSRLGAELTAALAADFEASRLADPAAVDALRDRLASRLETAGVAAADLRVELPLERNPVLVSAATRRIVALARPTGRKVLVVGWDGADWLLVRPLLEQGRLPHLARLVRAGVSGELRAELPLLSPLLWTSIATGRTVEDHGIADFLAKDPATGALVPVSSAARKVHALWTVLTAFGLRSDVVGWWATWPAEPILGTLVSDRVAYQLFDFTEREAERDTGKVHPAEAWPAIRGKLVSAEAVGCEEVRRFVDLDCAEIERRWAALPAERKQEDRVNHLRKIVATTRSYHAIALDLLRDQADLTMVYYEGTDTFGHLFARFLPPPMPGVSAEEQRAFGRALPEYYVYADELLGELLAAADPQTTVLLVSDHGFFTGEARPNVDPADFATGAPAWHRQFGVIVGAGPGLRPGEVRGAGILDVAPTVLALLGLPVPPDLAGRPLPELLPAGAAPPDRELLASFESLPRLRSSAAGSDPSQDAERLRELVALGYISPRALETLEPRAPGGEDGAGTAPSATAPAATSAAELQGASTEAYNLGRILQRKGDLEGAERQYRIAIERLPSFGQGYASLAQVASVRGRHSEALDHLIEGFRRSGDMPMAAVTGLVDEARQCGRLADAERVLAGLKPRFAMESAYHAALGFLAEEKGSPAEALAHYDRALALQATDELAIERKLTLLRTTGRPQEAQAAFDRAMSAAAGSVAAINHLGVVALRLGWGDRAEEAFRRVLRSDPGNPGVLANLAAAEAQQRKFDAAASSLREAIRRDPENAQNHFNLGAILAETGDASGALAGFEAAEKRGLRAPRVYVAIAKMRFRGGDPAGARRALEQALAVDPTHAEARSLMAALDGGG
jgi:tetratricopeptide (TPR) repeat protein